MTTRAVRESKPLRRLASSLRTDKWQGRCRRGRQIHLDLLEAVWVSQR